MADQRATGRPQWRRTRPSSAPGPLLLDTIDDLINGASTTTTTTINYYYTLLYYTTLLYLPPTPLRYLDAIEDLINRAFTTPTCIAILHYSTLLYYTTLLHLTTPRTQTRSTTSSTGGPTLSPPACTRLTAAAVAVSAASVKYLNIYRAGQGRAGAVHLIGATRAGAVHARGSVRPQ
jgi:hypothetical protein